MVSFNPKRDRSRETIKIARKITIKPTIAAIIWLRAASTCSLSPREVIHFNPPYNRYKRAITTASTTMATTIFPNVLGISAPRLHKAAPKPAGLFVHGSTPCCANAGNAKKGYINNDWIMINNFFTQFIISNIFSFVKGYFSPLRTFICIKPFYSIFRCAGCSAAKFCNIAVGVTRAGAGYAVFTSGLARVNERSAKKLS